jgi:hypothetical protein
MDTEDYDAAINNISNEINTQFNSSFAQAEKSFDVKAIGNNISITKTVSDVEKVNTSKLNEITREKDTYTRQGEINEWQAQNKLDTLFFLQILFIYLGIVIVLIFLRQAEVISNGSVYVVGGVLLLVVIGVLWNRSSYTEKSRDKRYWNRRYIGLNDSNLSATAQCSP